jgi:hypothetical protein
LDDDQVFRDPIPTTKRPPFGTCQRIAAGPEKRSFTNVYPMGTLSRMKDVGLRIRIDRHLREAFLAACKAEDKPAAQVLREYMRDYVQSHNQKPANDTVTVQENEVAGKKKT